MNAGFSPRPSKSTAPLTGKDEPSRVFECGFFSSPLFSSPQTLRLRRRFTENNKLSGWVYYSYGVARYRDAATNLSFYGDYDQRHTFNVYATYRFRPSLNLSAKYRYGSNFPIAGFLRFEDSRVRLSDQRNLARIPTYSRLDIRANKSFNFDRWKLTLYGEVLNVVRHRNIRYTSDVDTVNGRVSVSRDSMFPLLPIAGVRIEF